VLRVSKRTLNRAHHRTPASALRMARVVIRCNTNPPMRTQSSKQATPAKQEPAIGHAPQHHQLVGPSRGQNACGGAEGYGAHRCAVPLQLALHVGGLGAPQLAAAVERAGGQQTVFRREACMCHATASVWVAVAVTASVQMPPSDERPKHSPGTIRERGKKKKKKTKKKKTKDVHTE
jgi:hypothetical protein